MPSGCWRRTLARSRLERVGSRLNEPLGIRRSRAARFAKSALWKPNGASQAHPTTVESNWTTRPQERPTLVECMTGAGATRHDGHFVAGRSTEPGRPRPFRSGSSRQVRQLSRSASDTARATVMKKRAKDAGHGTTKLAARPTRPPQHRTRPSTRCALSQAAVDSGARGYRRKANEWASCDFPTRARSLSFSPRSPRPKTPTAHLQPPLWPVRWVLRCCRWSRRCHRRCPVPTTNRQPLCAQSGPLFAFRKSCLKPSRPKRRSNFSPHATCRRLARRNARSAKARSSWRFERPTCRWRSCDCVGVHYSTRKLWLAAALVPHPSTLSWP